MKINLDDPNLTAYAFDELSGTEKAQIEAAVFASPEAQEFVKELRLLSGNLRAEYAAERDAHVVSDPNVIPLEQKDQPWSLSRRLALAAGIALCAGLGAIAIGKLQRSERLGLAAKIHTGSPTVASTDILQTPPEAIEQPGEPAEKDYGPNSLVNIARNFATSAHAPPPTGPVPRPHAKVSEVDSSDPSAALAQSASRGLVAKQAPASSFSAGVAGGFDKKAEALRQDLNTARYGNIEENPFLAAASNPLSTFSIDVDTASYSNIRRFIENGSLPPKDAVRVEEMVNYFSYDYPRPNDKLPFSVNLDAAACPWQPAHRLVRIGLKGREVPNEKRPASNLVFLLDVSGSMEPANRLPLVKQAMRLLVDKLGENDRVAIVVYAGGSGLALPSTTGDHKEQILSAIENLQANGSTNGAEGIELAYQTAVGHFIKGGVNRVILATDGDFNIGPTSEGEMINLIQDKAKSGVFLSVLGVGDDNLNDSMMQKLADKGNGNYAYLDSVEEARKVLVRQINGTLVTIAKDVKIQVEFNPVQVASYRLSGYEKRVLRKEDFNNDKIDAGEIGAGHTVTALYEVVPAGTAPNPAESVSPVDDLKYQSNPAAAASSLGKSSSPEMMTVKLRYKEPDGDTSKLLSQSFVDRGADFAQAAPDLKFAAAVAEFGMILRDSEFKGNGSLGEVSDWAREGKGADENGYRAGFLELVRKAQALKKG
jgi:Ca-activated chloride channel family protein